MKSATKFISVLAVVLAANASFAAVDSYLYWMVDGAVYNSSPVAFNYATVSTDGGASYLNLYDGTENLGPYAGATTSPGTSTGAYYAGYDSSASFTTFLIELWTGSTDSGTRVGYQEYSLAAIGDYIARGMNKVGSPLTVTNVIPEPTSGLLMLFGIAALSLRRRKRAIVSAVAAIAAGATFAAANDLLITFSTPGPDTYADGTTVLDGERYALCWSTDFSQFSIKPDGTGEGGTVVLKAPVAKGGRCPTTVFEVNAAKVPDGGEWAVYLLDTRKFSKTGVASVGSASTVNTFGLVGNSVAVSTGSAGGYLAGTTGSATSVTGEVSAPTITGIKIDGGKVYVSVKGAPYLAYGLVEGATPDAVTDDVAGAKASATGEEEVTIVTDAKEGGAFFRVNRK